MCSKYIFVILFLLVTSNESRQDKCDDFNIIIDIDGIIEKLTNGLDNCGLTTNVTRSCPYLTIDLEIDGIGINTNDNLMSSAFHGNTSNIIKESLTSSSLSGDNDDDGTVWKPVTIAAASTVTGGAVMYFVVKRIKDMLQSNSYVFPEP